MPGYDATEEPLDDDVWRHLVEQRWTAAVAALLSIKDANDLESFMVIVLDTSTTEPLAELFGAVKGFPPPTSQKARLVRHYLDMACEDYMAAAAELQQMARDLEAGANNAIAGGGFRGRLALRGINSRSKKAHKHLQHCFTRFSQVDSFFAEQTA